MVDRARWRAIRRERMRAAKQKQEARDNKIADLEKRVKDLEDKAG